VNRVVREVCSLYDGVRDGLVIVARLPSEDLVGNLDPLLLSQALVNLVDNSVAAIDGPGTITVTARADNNDITITVADTGVGLPTEDAELLLQPFYSTKGKGSGIGLALVHRIVTEHGGSLKIGNRPHGGAKATVTLPGALLPRTADDAV